MLAAAVTEQVVAERYEPSQDRKGYRNGSCPQSELCKRFDPIGNAWNNRPPTQYPFVLVDALYLQVREDKRVRNHGVLLRISIKSENGQREVLDMMLGDTGSEESWAEFFRRLEQHGPRENWLYSDGTGTLEE